MSFNGRHCVVTGGTGALGIAVVEALLAGGATCHVPFAGDAGAERLRIRGEARLDLARCDMSDEDAVMRFYRSIPPPWASIHLVGGFAAGPLAESTKRDLMAMVGVNLVTCFLACRAAAAAMTSGGRIVNVAARPALEWRQGRGMAAYAASKAAVAALTVALAQEVTEQGILVNAVAPSIMDTPANRAAMPKADASSWPKVEEVAATILFLASPENRVTSGAVVPVYGRA